MRTYFVSGAEGFTGTHLLRALQSRGGDVVAGVRNRARKLALEKQSGKALVCDVADAINVARVIASVKPDAVIHLAGVARSQDAAEDPLTAYQSLVTSCANLLDAVRRAVPRCKVLLISAGEVYGAAGESGRPLTEATAPQPSTTFGALKFAAENIARAYFENYHLDVTIARPFGYTGAGQPEGFFFSSVAKRLATWDGAVQGSEFALPDLTCRRDLLHVDDVVRAYLRLVDEGKPNQTYNVSSGQTVEVREFAGFLAQCFGAEVQFREPPLGERGGERKPIATLCGAADKLRGELSWSPERSWQDAARDLAATYRTALQPV